MKLQKLESQEKKQFNKNLLKKFKNLRITIKIILNKITSRNQSK